MNQLQTLSMLKDGEKGTIDHFTNDQMATKLLSMGVLPGKSICVVRRLPFGGGLYIKIENQNIALREKEANDIVLEVPNKQEIYL